jgi:hypothetical protein
MNMNMINDWTWKIVTSSTNDAPLYSNDSKIEELENEIKELKKIINEFIDNPDKIRNIRKIDPYGEEEWDM